ncbi:MAG: transposase, partial [Planctomycetales bacterium]|nr:transposase [Planctomycetales bacterium]
MGRAKRADDGGMVFHVLNRANARATIFEKPEDYAAFERVLGEARERVDMRVLAYCLMPNHWHLVLWPRRDGDLSKFMGWLTLTHTQRWHAHHHTVGTGHLYQGRFKSFPVQDDEHFLTVCRYVERNALRANLAKRAEDWMWSSLWHRRQGDDFAQRVLSAWPVPCPRQWLSHVHKPQ